METREFVTIIKQEDKRLGNNLYVEGRINAIFHLTCKMDGGLRMGTILDRYHDAGCHYFKCITTDSDYDKAKQIIEVWYPGLCEFDYRLRNRDA